MQARVLHELDSHDGIVVEILAGVGAIRADAAHHRRQVEDEVGLLLAHQPDNLVTVPEVPLGPPGHIDIIHAAAFGEAGHYKRAQEAASAGDDDLLVAQAGHG